MIRFRKYKDLNFFSYFAITNYVAFFCSLLAIFLPIYINHHKNATMNIVDIMQLGFTSINILAMLVIIAIFFIFIVNMFFQPSWFTYFLNVILIVYLFVSPVLINFQLFALLKLHQSSLTLAIGSVLVMVSAMVFMAIEIYKVSVMDEFVNANIKEKRNKELEEYINARIFRFERKVKTEENEENVKIESSKKQRKNYKIKKAKLKTTHRYKRERMPKISQFIKRLDKIYKI